MVKIQVNSQGKAYIANGKALVADKYNVVIGNLLGNINSSGLLSRPTGNFDIIFDGVKDVNTRALSNKFMYTSAKNIYFPDLVRITGTAACFGMFYGCSLTSAHFPLLESVTGAQGLEQIFEYAGLKTCTFPKLKTLTGSACCRRLFGYTGSLEDIYFPALTTSSFGSTYTDQFTNLVVGSGTSRTHTIHFPSNLQSTISQLSGYPNFGGTSGYVVLSFDLPATS